MFVAQPLRVVHRLAGIVLGVSLALWIGTGLLFHVQPGRDEAYRSALAGVENPALRFRTSRGKNVLVDLVTGVVSQTGDLNGWIDRLCRIHYQQWTPWRSANVALVLSASLLALLLAASGLRLLFTPASRAPNGAHTPSP